MNAIKQTDVFQNYQAAQQKVAEQPDLQKQIDDFRMKNYEMQQQYEGYELLEKSDEFTKQYAAFRENQVVDEFLSAELAFCRFMQNMDDILLNELNFH